MLFRTNLAKILNEKSTSPEDKIRELREVLAARGPVFHFLLIFRRAHGELVYQQIFNRKDLEDTLSDALAQPVTPKEIAIFEVCSLVNFAHTKHVNVTVTVEE